MEGLDGVAIAPILRGLPPSWHGVVTTLADEYVARRMRTLWAPVALGGPEGVPAHKLTDGWAISYGQACGGGAGHAGAR